MRIIYIHQYFVTPTQGGGTRSYHLAKGMVAAGIEVELITAHGEDFYDYRIIDGIRVHYLPINYKQEYGFWKRILAFMRFAWKAKRLIKKLPRPEFLYISSTPLTVGWIGLWAKRQLAIPFIFEVRDLWPEAPIQVGVIRNPIVKRFLFRFETSVYRHALRVVALSPGIAASIRKKSPDTQIYVVPNFADTRLFVPTRTKNPTLLQAFGLKPGFTIIYAGAIGMINAVEDLVSLAELARQRGLNFQFVVMGKGSGLRQLQERVTAKKLENFSILPFGNKEKVRDLLSLADMAFVSFAQLPVLGTNSPNKFFDALAAGKAILVNHPGWVSTLVAQHNLGVFFDPKRPADTLDILQDLSVDQILLAQYQTNARELAEKHFSAEIAVQKTLAVIYPEHQPSAANDGAYILRA